MWAFDWFQTYFSSLRSQFDSTASAISSVPVLGSYLAYPFAWIASCFANLATAAGAASTWSNSVYASASQVFGAIDSTLRSAYPVLTASGSWFFDQIRSRCESYWSILTATGYQIFQRISGYCTQTWSILSDTRDSLWSYTRGQMLAAFAILSSSAYQIFQQVQGYCTQTWSILYDTRESLWSWISTSNLQGWAQSWFSGQSTVIINFVTAQWGYLITSVFSFLGSNWVSFESDFAWLVGKLIDLATRRAASFADALWDLVEAVVKKL